MAVHPFYIFFYHLFPAGIRNRRAKFLGDEMLLSILALCSMPLIFTTEALPEAHLDQNR